MKIGRFSIKKHGEADDYNDPPRPFMEHLIDHYVETGSPLDKAGAYGIQDEGALLVEAIHGDFYTVMGLPVAETARRLQKYLYA